MCLSPLVAPRQMPTCYPSGTRNPSINQVTLKTIKIQGDEEKKDLHCNSSYVFFKHSFTPLIISIMQNAAHFIILSSEENYCVLTRASWKGGSSSLWPSTSLTLDKGPSIWKCFPQVIPSVLFHTHTHNGPVSARTKLQSPRHRK